MGNKQTIKEFLDNNVNVNEVDLITIISNEGIVSQYDNVESLEGISGFEIEDYEIIYDSDEGMVYLEIRV
jgi:hypothetical protein